MIAISFAGFAIERVLSLQESLPSRVSPQTFPRKDGAVVPKQSFLGPRTVVLNCEIDKPTEAELKTYLENLSATLHSKGRDRLVIYDDNRYLNATKTGFSKQMNAENTPAIASRFGIEFFADDPYWYSTTQQTSTNAGVNTGSNFTITNNGGTRTPPRIVISGVSGVGVFIQITNTTTGLNVRYQGDIAVGQLITFDHTNFRALKAGGPALAGFSGTFFDLIPGAQNLRYDGSATATIVVEWLERWI